MRAKIYSSIIKVSADDELRAALAQAASDQRTSAAEVARRILRQGLSQRPSARATRAA